MRKGSNITMVLMSVRNIKDVDGRDFIFVEIYARAQYINIFPKVVEPNRIGKNCLFICLYEQASMPDKSGFYHRFELFEENLVRLTEWDNFLKFFSLLNMLKCLLTMG